MARTAALLLVGLLAATGVQLSDAYTHPEELEKLIAFRDEFRKRGPHWVGALATWECPTANETSDHECDPCGNGWWGNWAHISCRSINKLFRDDTVPGDGWVTIMHFSLTGVEGPAFHEVCEFNYINEWDMKVCNLEGTLPSWVPDCLPLLEEWDISRNHMTGTIPPSSGSIDRLVRFMMEGNHLSGSLPDTWQKLSKLEQISVFDNDLTGTIPPSYAGINGRLTQVAIGGNNFEGTLYPFANVLSQSTNISYLPKMCGMIPQGLMFAIGFDTGGSPALGLPCPDEVESGFPDPVLL